ncbi:MAG TPA: hypothetical protein VEK57_15625 [Thermoanaerobaculia bacterium]|nr:hypothetical protein [Thermoanaerobaculia bacterium]
MRTCFFGLGYEFDGGESPGVAINEHGVVVQVNKREAGWNLYARSGTIDQATVAWNDTGADRSSYTDGAEPQCAINNSGVIVEVHKREVGDKLYAMYGKINGTAIDWGESDDYDGDGKLPAVALNDGGRVVSVFQKNDDELRCRVGQVDADDEEIDWKDDPEDFATGVRPRVAMNNGNYVIAVWSASDEVSAMKYRVGVAGSTSVDWEDEEHDLHEWFGYQPAIALTNDNFVVVVYRPNSVDLNQLTGRLNTATKTIEWDHDGAALYYDDGENPAVAAAGSMAITIHKGQSLARLWYSTSIVTDRANWMRDRLPQLGSRTLRELYFPASHDSAMYTEGLSIIAKTQELTVLEQLENGIRYFDLRPQWDPGLGEFVIHHNNVNGPTLLMILSEIQAFCREHQD